MRTGHRCIQKVMRVRPRVRVRVQAEGAKDIGFSGDGKSGGWTGTMVNTMRNRFGRYQTSTISGKGTTLNISLSEKLVAGPDLSRRPSGYKPIELPAPVSPLAPIRSPTGSRDTAETANARRTI
jgi:hypothetical protein